MKRSLTLEAHKVPVSVSVGSSSIDLDMEEIGELIQVLHTIKAQHKTFVNVQPMGAQALSGILEKKYTRNENQGVRRLSYTT